RTRAQWLSRPCRCHGPSGASHRRDHLYPRSLKGFHASAAAEGERLPFRVLHDDRHLRLVELIPGELLLPACRPGLAAPGLRIARPPARCALSRSKKPLKALHWHDEHAMAHQNGTEACMSTKLVLVGCGNMGYAMLAG